jgi:hypothetical protein
MNLPCEVTGSLSTLLSDGLQEERNILKSREHSKLSWFFNGTKKQLDYLERPSNGICDGMN